MDFQKILVANRGEIALRIMRTCRVMGIGTAAIYADPDRHAPFVHAADEAVYIGPPMTGSSFLAVDKIIEAARTVRADAIHPGYGFLAENADFAQACADAGIAFIGPTPDAIRCMGTKIEAKEIAAAAGVPTIPGFSAGGLSQKQIAERAARIGFPVLIKASAGGGGKGMRIVDGVDGLTAALAAARREAKAAFGDDTLLVERYIPAPRHIEIQILGDTYGNIVHCFERECSIQRRYQKIIEEAPSPALDEKLRSRMGEAAVAIAKAIGYRNAGTVEFVADQDGNFYFLEVNTRLQVEHPVTEEITGLDLVRLQIEIAQGRPLPFRQADLAIRGHSIEARIYAEDPERDFLPSIGTILCWETSTLPGVRYDSGIEKGSEVSIHYDPMLAKVVAHGPTRREAVQRLVRALSELRLHGVRNNRAFLLEILQHPAFLAGQLDTHFIPRHFDLRERNIAGENDRIHALAVALWAQEQRRATAPVLHGIPSGWRNNPSQRQWAEFYCGEAQIRVEYHVLPHRKVDGLVDTQNYAVEIIDCTRSGISLSIDDIRRTFRIFSQDDSYSVQSVLGVSEFREESRFPEPVEEEVRGGCIAPMPGKVLAIRIAVGDPVKKGDVLLILEAMKMEHEVIAPTDGVIAELRAEVGQQVDAGTILVVIDEGPQDAT